MAAPTSAPGTAQAETSALQEQAQRHLWMHFTRMGSFGPEHEVPIIVKGDGCYVWDDHGNRYLDGLSALFCVNSGPRPHGARRRDGGAGARARLHHGLELRPPQGDRARDPDRFARPGRPEPRLLHEQRLGGGRVGDQARPRLPPGPGQRPEGQADRTRDRLPRDHPRARSQRPGSRRCAASSSRSSPAVSTFPTRTAIAGRPTATRSGQPTRSSRRSSSRGPRPWPP